MDGASVDGRQSIPILTIRRRTGFSRGAARRRRRSRRCHGAASTGAGSRRARDRQPARRRHAQQLGGRQRLKIALRHREGLGDRLVLLPQQAAGHRPASRPATRRAALAGYGPAARRWPRSSCRPRDRAAARRAEASRAIDQHAVDLADQPVPARRRARARSPSGALLRPLRCRRGCRPSSRCAELSKA